MIFSIDKEPLINALSLISGCLAGKGIESITKCVLMEGAGMSIKLTAIDLDLCVTTEFFSVVEEDFSLCVPYRQLLTLIKLLKKDTINFDFDEGLLMVKSGSSRHKLPLYRREEFPNYVNPEVKVAKLPAKLLREMLSSAQIAVAKDNSGAWMLTCVNMRCGDGKVRLSSSDGKQMALAVASSITYKPMDALIPLSSVTALLKLTDCAGDATVFFDPSGVKLETEKGTVCTRLMEGKFPDLAKVIPSTFDKTFRIQGDEFALLCKRASLSSGPKRDVWCTFFKDSVLMESQDPGKGKSEETMELLGSNSEEPTHIGFQCDRVEDCLSRFSGEFTLEVMDKMPMRFIPIESDFDFQYLTMPLRKVTGEEPDNTKR